MKIFPVWVHEIFDPDENIGKIQLEKPLVT